MPVVVTEIKQSDVSLFKKDLDLKEAGYVLFKQKR